MTIQRMVDLLEIEHECMLRKSHNGCDGKCVDCDLVQDDGELHEMYSDVIELLKAQEPRVMTLEEVKQERICWIEDADDGMTVRLFPATMFGIGEYANGSKSYMFLAQKPWAIDANDCEWWYLIEDYGEIWRCWTSRPDEKRRAETPWNM